MYEVKEIVCTYCLVGIHPRELSKVSEISLAVRATAENQPKASDPEYGKFPSEKSSSRQVIFDYQLPCLGRSAKVGFVYRDFAFTLHGEACSWLNQILFT